MNKISIEVQDITTHINMHECSISISNYECGGYDIGVDFTPEWSYTRAVQHALSIIDAIVNNKIL